jgi:hypothetical protein
MTKERTDRQSCGEWIEGFDQSKIESINLSNNMDNDLDTFTLNDSNCLHRCSDNTFDDSLLPDKMWMLVQFR